MLVDDMVSAVRQMADEQNTTDLTTSEIVAALNRGQQRLVRLAARHYEPLFMRETTLTTFSGREATIPEFANGLIIDMVDVSEGNRFYRVHPIPIRDASNIDDTSHTTNLPSHYAIRGNKILLYPKPTSSTSVRIRYQLRPPELVVQEGRITNIDDLASNILYVNTVGSNLTTSITSLKAFVNVIDGTTGDVKDTLQISAIDSDSGKLTFKSSSLDRTLVFGQTVSSSLSTDIALDDYITLAHGTCIPTYTRDYSDFLIQHAVVEVLNRMGIPTQEFYAKYKELEDDVKSMWAGRPSFKRVAHKSKHWNRRIRGRSLR